MATRKGRDSASVSTAIDQFGAAAGQPWAGNRLRRKGGDQTSDAAEAGRRRA